MNEVIETFETNQCTIIVLKLAYKFADEDIYCIISIHKNEGKINTRFGNKTQMEGIVNTYVRTRA